jgi:D-3-phosphoglycerate dehydrogenase
MNKKESSSKKNVLSDRRVVVIDTGYASYEYERKVLEGAGYVLDIFQSEQHDRYEKMAFAKNAIGLFCRGTIINAEFLDAVPTLKAVVRYGVGYESIDLFAATTRAVRVANVQGYANHSVSDHALGLMFACARALPLAQKVLKTRFSKPPVECIFEFNDKTLGIVGLGRIGGTLCKKAKTLFKRILAVDPYIPDKRFIELEAIKTDLNTLLTESHVISLHCNLTEETTQLIDRKAFSQMQQRPIFINTARGAVVDEDALWGALQRDQLHSAGLDVFCNEPPLANRDELLAHPHVIATGHYAWYSKTAMIELQKRAAENMLMLLQGNIPEDCLNP